MTDERHVELGLTLICHPKREELVMAAHRRDIDLIPVPARPGLAYE